MVREPDATTHPTLQDHQLMSKHRVLGFKPQLRLWRGTGWPERNRAARSFRQFRRFHHVINSNKVFGTHNGTFSLADARRERDKAKDLLKEGKDPSTEKQLDKHRQAAARPFEQWADEWLAKKKVEKVKRGTQA